MGQIQDKIEEQITDKVQYHLKNFNELIKTVRDLDKQGLWPFDKISAKQFLLTAEPFLDAMTDIYKADAIRFAGVAIPALKDKIASTSIELTKCIHELELETIGEKKTALFAIIPDNDTSFNFLVSMLYTQLFQQLFLNLSLCKKKDCPHKYRCPETPF